MSENKTWQGLVVFRNGFRPFFLAAGISGLGTLVVWVLLLNGIISIQSTFSPVQWHAHEMIFGMTASVIAGFILTAIPNWTGRMPLQGWPLIFLFSLWMAGRISMSGAAALSAEVIAIIDSAFLLALFGVVVREIIAGRNWKNLPVSFAVGALAASNTFSHLEILGLIADDGLGFRMGIAIIVTLISLIGGRIIPSFTRNWLVKNAISRLPAAFGKFDVACVLLTACALAIWVIFPNDTITGIVVTAAGLANTLRISRWQGHRTIREPLVWSMHLGYAWVPVGLLLLGGAYFDDIFADSAGIHALTTGAIASMVLAVMTRATLGHTNSELTADNATTLIYGLVFLAAVTRVAAPIIPSFFDELLLASALSWCGAFGVFTIRYGTILLVR